MLKTDQEESVAGIVFSDDRKEVLLIKRRDVPVWVLPGGGIESGESPEEAALRELEEETSCKALLVKKIAEYTPMNRLARFTHFFEFKLSSGKLSLTDETQGVSFFPLDHLPPMPPPYVDWISDAAKNPSQLIQKKITSVNYKNFLKLLFLHPILVFRFLLSRIGLHIND